MPRAQTHDYVIVGGGSAGCVLASRLSEDADVRVLLLEAGDADRHWRLKFPLKFRDLMSDQRVSWGYATEPEPHLDGRTLPVPRGRVLGGSSSTNGMIYCRAHPRDYDQWRQLGLAGWGYGDVLPYFKRSEDFPGGDPRFHGHGGPLGVSAGDSTSHVHQAYAQASRNAGYPVTPDHNTLEQEGFGPVDLTIRDGRRSSTSQAFLKPVRRRPNLTVVTRAHASRVLFEQGRAAGVEYVRDGRAQTVRAEREVIVCGGVYNSPHVLMLSGIGPADDLAGHGIKVVHDAAQVGRNMQDHVHVGVAYGSDQMRVFDSELRFDRLALGVVAWALFKRGHLTTMPFPGIAYFRSRPELERPDVELMLQRVDPQAQIWFPGVRKANKGFLGCRATLLHPESRGSVSLRSADPRDKIVIRHNHLSAENDLRTMRAGVRMARDLHATTPLKDMVADEVMPGPAIRSDAEIDAYVRRTAAMMFHATSTCRMGTDAEAVVDGALKVNGVSGLRVVDASVMPFVPGGHTNAATIMIAEKAADLIRGRPAPEPIEV